MVQKCESNPGRYERQHTIRRDDEQDGNPARYGSDAELALRDLYLAAVKSFLFQAEQNPLSEIGRDDLAGKVRWVAKEDGDGAGYDILSFSRYGDERWLEVKTTNGPATTPFWITENERRASEDRPDVFRLARLHDFSRVPATFRLRPPLTDHVRLSPSQYRATF